MTATCTHSTVRGRLYSVVEFDWVLSRRLKKSAKGNKYVFLTSSGTSLRIRSATPLPLASVANFVLDGFTVHRPSQIRKLQLSLSFKQQCPRTQAGRPSRATSPAHAHRARPRRLPFNPETLARGKTTAKACRSHLPQALTSTSLGRTQLRPECRRRAVVT